MHEPRFVELSHPSINNRTPGPSILPGLEVFLVVLPLHLVELLLKVFEFGVKHPWEVVADVNVEISPVELRE